VPREAHLSIESAYADDDALGHSTQAGLVRATCTPGRWSRWSRRLYPAIRAGHLSSGRKPWSDTDTYLACVWTELQWRWVYAVTTSTPFVLDSTAADNAPRERHDADAL